MAEKETKEPKDAKDPKEAGDGHAEPTAAAAPKKSRGKLFMIIGLLVVLLGGGGAGAYFVLLKPAAPEGEHAATEKKKKKPEETGIVTFEPFVVNLADPNARRFLRISVRLIVDSEEEAKHIQESEVLLMRLRSDILEQLTEQTSERISSTEGKAELKKSIAERAHHILEPAEVSDVLFSDFVVQY